MVWECAGCTFINVVSGFKCEVCGTLKPTQRRKVKAPIELITSIAGGALPVGFEYRDGSERRPLPLPVVNDEDGELARGRGQRRRTEGQRRVTEEGQRAVVGVYEDGGVVGNWESEPATSETTRSKPRKRTRNCDREDGKSPARTSNARARLTRNRLTANATLAHDRCSLSPLPTEPDGEANEDGEEEVVPVADSGAVMEDQTEDSFRIMEGDSTRVMSAVPEPTANRCSANSVEDTLALSVPHSTTSPASRESSRRVQKLAPSRLLGGTMRRSNRLGTKAVEKDKADAEVFRIRRNGVEVMVMVMEEQTRQT